MNRYAALCVSVCIGIGSGAANAQELPPPKSNSQADVGTWAEANLTLTGWYYYNHTTEVVRFISRPAPMDPADHFLVKLRAERLTGPGSDGERSLISDVEFDCSRRVTRILNTIVFANHDLRAPVLSRRTEIDAWREPEGTVMAEAVERICGAAPAYRPSPPPVRSNDI